ncbi:MAG TPA: outer membrane protein assembly factor BamC [Cellvibrionaceae bacterium]
MAMLLAGSLAGCGVFWGDDAYFRNRDGDFQRAETIDPVKLPDGMSDEKLGELYIIPPIVESDFEAIATDQPLSIPRPQPLATNALAERVKIQRLGNQRWMLMNVAPGELWPRVRNFLNTNSVPVASADISRGLIDTHWVQFKTDLSTSDRYRVQIDQGVQPDTSEIHILHQSLPGTIDPDQERAWPAVSTSAEREAWLLDELAATLAADETIGGTSMLAQAIGGSPKSSLAVEDSEPVIKIKLNQERAQATLNHAVRQEGFGLFERDAERDIYYVNYRPIEDEEDKGWISRLFSRSPKLVNESPYTLAQLLTQIPTGDDFVRAPLSNREAEKNFAEAPGYLLFVTGEENAYTVRLRDPYGKRLDPREARELLTILRKNLI